MTPLERCEAYFRKASQEPRSAFSPKRLDVSLARDVYELAAFLDDKWPGDPHLEACRAEAARMLAEAEIEFSVFLGELS